MTPLFKVTKHDGFVWLRISKEEAYDLYRHEDIYKLYDDDSEGYVENIEDLDDWDGELGIEVGFIKDIVAEFFKE